MKLLIFLLFQCLVMAQDPNELNLPFLRQWLCSDTTNVVYPKIVTVNTQQEIQWSFTNDKWVAEGYCGEVIRFQPDVYIGQADILVNGPDGGWRKYVIEGAFKMTITESQVVSCDITGDNKVDLQDFALFSKMYLLEPNELPIVLPWDTEPPAVEPNELVIEPATVIGYQLDGSHVVHLYPDCHYISGKAAKEVNLVDALIGGDSVCSACEKRAN